MQRKSDRDKVLFNTESYEMQSEASGRKCLLSCKKLP